MRDKEVKLPGSSINEETQETDEDVDKIFEDLDSLEED